MFVSFVVVSFHFAWNLPDFVPDRRFNTQNAAASSNDNERKNVRIFFANVLATNHDFTPLWKEIEDAKPDVVVLAECTRFSNKSFRQTPAMAEFVNANGQRPSQFGEVRIYSKLPIKSESQHWIAERLVQKVDVDVSGTTLRVVGIHAPRPQVPGYDYYGYYGRVVPLLTAEPGPVVMIGDFNATQHSLVYKQLKAGGLRSAHEVRGRGYATTWPNGRWPVPPVRIDQAFLSADLECMGIAEGQGIGSDHKPLIVDVAVRPTVALAPDERP
jgi:endonuclease/exonuclease/phosphatase (EEP) superfamily protein YafD